jgi:hypothetical protein
MLAPAIVALLLVHAPPKEGIWRVTSDKVDVTRQQWSIYCDEIYEKKNQTPRTTSGLEVEVSVDGERFLVSGGSRRFGTEACEGRNGSLEPEGTRQDGDVRVIDCNSKRVVLGTERGVQQVSSTDTQIRFRSDLVQTFKANGDDCVSKLARQSALAFVRPKPVPGDAPPPVVDTPVAEAAPVDPCATPGALHKLTVEPALHTATVGDRPACFRVVALDDKGCVLETPALVWTVDPSSAGDVTAAGCFSPAPTSEEQGVGVIVKAGEKDALATVRILPEGQGQSKKSIAALAKTSKSERVRELLAEVARGELVIRPLSTDGVVVEGEASPMPWATVAGALGAALFGSGALLYVQRRRRRNAPPATELQATPVAVPTKGGGLQCPTCKFEFAKGEASLCPFDGATLVELERDARQTMFIPVVGGMICPQCSTRYPTKARFCGHDGTPLLPDFGGGPPRDPV